MELELLAVTKSGASKGAKKKEHFSRCATDVSFRAERK